MPCHPNEWNHAILTDETMPAFKVFDKVITDESKEDDDLQSIGNIS